MGCDDQYCGGYTPGCERFGICKLDGSGFKNINVGCFDWSEDPPQYEYNNYNPASTY